MVNSTARSLYADWSFAYPTNLPTQTLDGSIEHNQGTAVPDYIAVGKESEAQATWRKREGIKPENQIKLAKLAHMRYQHPNLDEITVFLKDFGMHVAKRTVDEVWYRGYGHDQYVYYARQGPKKFLGGAYEVETFEDLEKAARLPTTGKIKEMTDAPGGGHIITLTDPEGFPISLFYGQKPAETGDYPKKIVLNYEVEKPRARMFNRFSPGPAAVHKLGHYGLCVLKFGEQVDFYTRTFNLVPTDFLYVGEGDQRKNVAIFAHIDRGENLVDHHSFFMSTNDTGHVHHCYESVWGVGRHILGSQIFDHWWDTTGNMIEHYADGDLINDKSPIGYSLAGDESLAVWGPELPAWFLK
ncbi:Glyoxalase/Bleomycin resistance protein/Dihydroxybiphenyl dioxygenase [Talaromyces proteolyticus]|uniref:Glyoxalase/Bleomycin resistance protein/Dihydroxybiphenyl dioxygenase n=1 Tax=Talaromyces proteolyticus TaxID=1131652 RepID=A0AAD4PUJ0_9EURO|nr:Glyoxalase/Bleomycin resistance protein/Dihydroxybiphenyl dioxygenase [Talaromyces proteolyticus]KAH8689430.1 Glyoxalase/Bleomycin resistance protein/Dihydroxybiphenyl dioxygenase [Talaromyces proteolyticus]